MNKYHYRKQKPKSFKLLFVGIYVLGFILIYLFNDTGYLKSKKLEKENFFLEKKIEKKINLLNQLEKEKVRLEEDLINIEKIAREEFKMAKKGEKVFTIIHKQEK